MHTHNQHLTYSQKINVKITRRIISHIISLYTNFTKIIMHLLQIRMFFDYTVWLYCKWKSVNVKPPISSHINFNHNLECQCIRSRSGFTQIYNSQIRVNHVSNQSATFDFWIHTQLFFQKHFDQLRVASLL